MVENVINPIRQCTPLLTGNRVMASQIQQGVLSDRMPDARGFHQSVCLVDDAVALALGGCLPNVHRGKTVAGKEGMSIAKTRTWHYNVK